jgi:N-succinyl-L-ornithine transcarbamylase
MKNFIQLSDIGNPEDLVSQALAFKKDPFLSRSGERKTLGLLFFNPSLRTRLSTQKAAQNLGMNVMVMNVDADGWKLEFEDGVVMDGFSQEHISDAIRVICEYVDIIGVRTFPGLKDREEDYSEKVMSSILAYATKPVISLESAIRHPLQSLADIVTIRELGIIQPKVVLSWAPHPRALPQAVPNSFLEWVKATDAQITVACPKGYELADEFMKGVTIDHDQENAFKEAHIIYAKNWSSFHHYGERLPVNENWTITEDKMKLTNHGKFMHCLPIRRNVIATDAVLEHHSVIYQQAGNRVFAAQAVIDKICTS